jgi:hypothetical protein
LILHCSIDRFASLFVIIGTDPSGRLLRCGLGGDDRGIRAPRAMVAAASAIVMSASLRPVRPAEHYAGPGGSLCGWERE